MMQTTVNSQRSLADLIIKLQSIQIGGNPQVKIKRKDLVHLFRNLTTLVSNGVSVAQSLETLATDKTLKNYRTILRSLSDLIRTGNSLSVAMRRFPESFSWMVVHQIHVGEEGGNLTETLKRITAQIEESSNLRSFLIKKLTYPMLLMCAGFGSVTFMMLCVIPTFQEMYANSGATLPWITEFLIGIADFVSNELLMILICLAALVGVCLYSIKTPSSRFWIDQQLLRVPVLGDWFRNLAMLQFMDGLGNLMEAGFTLADALPPGSSSVSNRFVRSRLQGLHGAIRRGERFSLAMEKENELFPPVVKQLVVVGERTGNLVQITGEIRTHLRRDVEKYTTAMLGALEPVLTALLAVMVGGILMAIYLPMFDMIGQVKS